jgi:hypothetical protein
MNHSPEMQKTFPNIKTSRKVLHGAAAVLALGALCCGLTGRATPLPDTDTYTNSFGNAGSTTSWIYWYGNGSNNNSMTWDAAVDANNNAGSGSLLFETTFPAGNQLAWFGTFGNRWGYDTEFTHDATKYTNITFDVHVDPSSALSTAGTFGNLQIGFYGGPNVLGSQTIPASATNGWVHIVQPIDPSTPGIGTVSGLAFRIQTYDNYNNPVGHLKFWIDNLKLVVSPVVPPPPRLAAPVKPVSGLNLGSSSSNGDQYQRTSIRLNNDMGVGWLGASGPVTYSFAVTNFPTGSGYQAHLFITTGGIPPSFETAPDYVETNVIFVQIGRNANGTGTAAFRYKVNEFQSNSNMFGAEYIGDASAGTLANITTPTVLGNWSITFNQDTNVTLSGPGGVTTNFTMRAAAVANFAEPLNILFGAQPNNSANIGQSVVLAQAGISGIANPVNDNFMADSTLDTSTWSPLAGDVTLAQVVPNDPGSWLIKWTLPDAGFGLQTTTNLTNPNSWTTLTGPEATGGPLSSYTAAGSRITLVPSASLSPGVSYFRLIDQSYRKLQVLTDGETAAPGTTTGKTGTPSSVPVGGGVTITVNAVDNHWYLVNSVIDSIHITTTDPTATITPSTDISLYQGSQTYTVNFGTAGNYTVTASDVSDPSKASDTTATITVTP